MIRKERLVNQSNNTEEENIIVEKYLQPTYVCGIIPNKHVTIIQGTKNPWSICCMNVHTLHAVTFGRKLLLYIQTQWHGESM